MRRVAAGDATSFATIYDRHSHRAYSLARALMRDATAAEDVTQEAFLSAWRGAESFDDRLGSFQSWLMRIVRNRAIDHIRKSKNQALRHEPDGDLALAAHPDPLTLHELVAEAELRERITASLADIPREQAQVIALAYFLGLTRTQIASTLDLPEGTVKGRIRLALAKLRGLLTDAGAVAEHGSLGGAARR